MRLSRAGWWPERVSGSLDEETKRTARDWRTDRENEGLNPFRAMLDALQTRFRLRRPAWHPYPFWDLAADMRMPADREGRWPAACGTRKPRFSDSDTCEVCCSQRQSFRELLEVLCFDACFDPQRKALSVRVVLHPDLLTLAERPQLSPS